MAELIESPSPKKEPDPRIIETLELLLEHARSGSLSSLAVAAIHEHGRQFGTGLHVNEATEAMALCGPLDMLKHRILTKTGLAEG